MLPYFVLLYLSVADAISLTSELINTWDNFKSTYEKKYKFGFEDKYRFKVFKENMKKIDMHNKRYEQGKETYKMAANKFTDLTSEEFLSTFTCYKKQNTTRYSTGSVFLTPNFVKIPETVDWRDHGYVTPVKDQGACGSCWAFSATGSLEGQHFKKSKMLVPLSEQNLVDCCLTTSTHGCEGGLMDTAFSCIQSSNGIDTESSYPYKGEDEDCSFDPQSVGATVTGFVDIPEGSEDKLVEAIATVGPISVAIHATEKFQFYHSGVLDDDTCSPELLNHGVLAVGYGLTRNGTKYYIVKNSWSQTWGQAGYILMSRDKKNQCGIASAASYPLV